MGLQRDPQKLLSVMAMFNNLPTVMVSWIYMHTQIDLKLITWHTLCVTSGMTIIAYQTVIIFI